VKHFLALGAVLTLVACAGTDHAHHAPGKTADRQQMWQKSLARAPVAATAAFDARGRMWLATVDNGHILLRYSNDLGKTFSTSLRVNPEPERVAADGENRPKLAFGKHGEVYVSWTQSLEVPFAGHVRFAVSNNDGWSFSTPITVNDDRAPISHRFDALIVDGAGRVHLLWLDKRDRGKAGKTYAGIALYHAVSADGGKSFGPNRKLADHTCECCRIAVALDTDGTPVIAWRQVYGGNVRDHAWLRLDGRSAPQRLSHEQWALDACPHHGPALAIGPDGVHHAAWYSGAPQQSGLFCARSADGVAFTTPLPFGDNDAQAGHPAVLSLGRAVFLAWKEFDGKNTVIRLMRSNDGGTTWSAPATPASTTAASDHPQLVAHGRRAWLGWNTAREGFRLVEVTR
jgi:hypothetical protein